VKQTILRYENFVLASPANTAAALTIALHHGDKSASAKMLIIGAERAGVDLHELTERLKPSEATAIQLQGGVRYGMPPGLFWNLSKQAAATPDLDIQRIRLDTSDNEIIRAVADSSVLVSPHINSILLQQECNLKVRDAVVTVMRYQIITRRAYGYFVVTDIGASVVIHCMSICRSLIQNYKEILLNGDKSQIKQIKKQETFVRMVLAGQGERIDNINEADMRPEAARLLNDRMLQVFGTVILTDDLAALESEASIHEREALFSMIHNAAYDAIISTGVGRVNVVYFPQPERLEIYYPNDFTTRQLEQFPAYAALPKGEDVVKLQYKELEPAQEEQAETAKKEAETAQEAKVASIRAQALEMISEANFTMIRLDKENDKLKMSSDDRVGIKDDIQRVSGEIARSGTETEANTAMSNAKEVLGKSKKLAENISAFRPPVALFDDGITKVLLRLNNALTNEDVTIVTNKLKAAAEKMNGIFPRLNGHISVFVNSDITFPFGKNGPKCREYDAARGVWYCSGTGCDTDCDIDVHLPGSILLKSSYEHIDRIFAHEVSHALYDRVVTDGTHVSELAALKKHHKKFVDHVDLCMSRLNCNKKSRCCNQHAADDQDEFLSKLTEYIFFPHILTVLERTENESIIAFLDEDETRKSEILDNARRILGLPSEAADVEIERAATTPETQQPIDIKRDTASNDDNYKLSQKAICELSIKNKINERIEAIKPSRFSYVPFVGSGDLPSQLNKILMQLVSLYSMKDSVTKDDLKSMHKLENRANDILIHKRNPSFVHIHDAFDMYKRFVDPLEWPIFGYGIVQSGDLMGIMGKGEVLELSGNLEKRPYKALMYMADKILEELNRTKVSELQR
jgi:hypothetical protein